MEASVRHGQINERVNGHGSRLTWVAPCMTLRVDPMGGLASRMTLLSFLFCPFQIVVHSELHNGADQAERNWLVQWKSHRALCAFIGGQRLLELLNPSWRGIEADVPFVRGKMNQIAVQSEGRHLILDCFFRVG